MALLVFQICSIFFLVVSAISGEDNEIRERLLVGGHKPLDLSDPNVLKLADLGLYHINAASNSPNRKVITSIKKATSQVVSGILTRLTVNVAETNCSKGSPVHALCTPSPECSGETCHITIWSQVWLDKTEVNHTCQPHIHQAVRTKRMANIPIEDKQEQFNNFVDKYSKTYKDDVEFHHRFRIFRANLKKIQTLQETEQGTAVYGLTQFADLSVSEFKQKHLGLNRNLLKPDLPPMKKATIPDVELPKEFDWRHYNVVTGVKNQGSCGSCWAFSVTGNVEGQWAVHHGKLISLSEQELVDCDTLDEGCNGGLPDLAYRSIERLGGLETENQYPYDGATEKCKFNQSDVQVSISGAVNISSNETKMAQWLFKNGPISIGINANAMQFYMGGVSHPLKFLCNHDSLDHGVLIVGFGVHRSWLRHKMMPYWLIKNSWGRRWGEQGYYRVYRGDGTCGVNMMASSAVVD